VVFGRPDSELARRRIREVAISAESESAFLNSAADIMADYVKASRSKAVGTPPVGYHPLQMEPMLLCDSSSMAKAFPADQAWVHVCVPIRFTKGDGAVILLGRREGGRRYLSEDLREIGRLAAVMVEQVERYRSCEVQRLVSQAELRALQSQINPHFLFNALNTLYGTIPRESADARRMVLNLAEIFRYSLRADRTMIPLSEELEIVRAYLEIETLRLGDKLKTEISVDQTASTALIPVLSVQPLIENAVKHGVAGRSGPGTVRLDARTTPNGVCIEVSDDGGGFQPLDRRRSGSGGGVGLENVRQRLRLCFGESSCVQIESTDRGSMVSFLVPATRTPQSLGTEMAR